VQKYIWGSVWVYVILTHNIYRLLVFLRFFSKLGMAISSHMCAYGLENLVYLHLLFDFAKSPRFRMHCCGDKSGLVAVFLWPVCWIE